MFNSNKGAWMTVASISLATLLGACSDNKANHKDMEVVELSAIYRIQPVNVGNTLSGQNASNANLYMPLSDDTQTLLSYEVTGSMKQEHKEKVNDSETLLAYKFEQFNGNAQTVRIDAKVGFAKSNEKVLANGIESIVSLIANQSTDSTPWSCAGLAKLLNDWPAEQDKENIFLIAGFSKSAGSEKYKPSCWYKMLDDNQQMLGFYDPNVKEEQLNISNYISVNQINSVEEVLGDGSDSKEGFFFDSRHLFISLTSN